MRPHLFPRRGAGLALLLILLGLSGACVTSDATTGQPIPRGNPKYPFAKAEKAAEELTTGMTRARVLLLLGSPAEMSETGDVWIYLPERYGILIPAKALRLEFKANELVKHDFQAIVLGARL